MTAYGLGKRFDPSPPCVRLLDPGAYDSDGRPTKPNKYPFLSKTPRKTDARRAYTDKIYDAAIPHSIPNCSSLKSKTPRFSYESFSQKDLEDLLCRCGLQNPCECPTEGEEEKEIICQAEIRRRLFVGPPPRSKLAGGISCPSKRDRGFDVNPDGSIRRLIEFPKPECPPFYDTRIKESTEFYRGWKWSQWRSQRAPRSIEVRPGPADYTIEGPMNPNQKCYEYTREYKRMTSKPAPSKDIKEGPGPADYTPQLPKGTDLKNFGTKAERFIPMSKNETRPGPADHSIKRDFDLPDIPYNPRFDTLRLPSPSGFGSKSARFKYRVMRIPGPADYNADVKLCRIVYCGSQNAPFNCSAKRFPRTEFDNGQEYDDDDEDGVVCEDENDSDDDDKPLRLPKPAECPQISSQFKSNFVRFKPLTVKLNEPSPADLGPDLGKKKLPEKTLYQRQIAPFLSSQGRFQSWHNWLSVHNVHGTPGPGYYNAHKHRCYPAVRWGPMFRAPRFGQNRNMNPGPNEYQVNTCDVATYNQRLLDNIEKRIKFDWKKPEKPRKLSFRERELLLLDKAIANLSTTDLHDAEVPPVEKEPQPPPQPRPKTKMLRYYLYKHQIDPSV